MRQPLVQCIPQMMASLLAIFINSILFLLICFRSPQNLGGYKFLMMYFAAFQIFYAFFDLFFLPYVWSNLSFFFVLVDPIFDLPKGVIQVLNYVFIGSFAMLMAMFSIHFVFRYCVVSGIKRLTSTEPLKLLVWISIPLIVGMMWIAVGYTFFGENPISNDIVKRNMGELLPYVGPVFDFRLDYDTNEHVYHGVFLDFLIGFSCFFTTIFFGIKCYISVRALTKDSTKSYSYKSLQAQLFYVLVAQATIPFFFIFLPVSVLAVTILFNWSNHHYGKVLTLANAVYPILDPIPNLLMIKSYRTALTPCVCRLKPPSKKVAALPNIHMIAVRERYRRISDITVRF